MNDLELLPIRCEDDRVAVVDHAAAALAHVATPTDAKRVADLAAAAEKYGKLKRADKEALSRTVALKVDAMARMGELLAAMELSEGGRPTETGSQMEPVLTLHEMGISKKESMYAQSLAIVKETNPDLYRSIRETGRIKDAHDWLKKQEEQGVSDDGDDKREDPDWFEKGQQQFRELIALHRKADALAHDILRTRAGKFLARVLVCGEELYTLRVVRVETRHGSRDKRMWVSRRQQSLLDSARRTQPVRICAGCRGAKSGCRECQHSGFIPHDEEILAVDSQHSLDFTEAEHEETPREQ